MIRPRFTLRTLAIVVTVLCAYMGYRANRERECQAIIREIESVGGTVNVAPLGWWPSFPSERIMSVTIPDSGFDPTRLNAFPGFNIRRLEGTVMGSGVPAYSQIRLEHVTSDAYGGNEHWSHTYARNWNHE